MMKKMNISIISHQKLTQKNIISEVDSNSGIKSSEIDSEKNGKSQKYYKYVVKKLIINMVIIKSI